MRDGCSRYIVHWELRLQMTVLEVELTAQRAKEKFPDARPRIISDNGPQFIAKDFKEFIRLCEMTHVRTAPFYPQSNGKQERWHQSFKAEGWRPGVPVSYEDGLRVAGQYVDYYNTGCTARSDTSHPSPVSRTASRTSSMLVTGSSKRLACAAPSSDELHPIPSTRVPNSPTPILHFRLNQDIPRSGCGTRGVSDRKHCLGPTIDLSLSGQKGAPSW